MALRPLRASGNPQTVVDSKSEYQDGDGVHGNRLCLRNADLTQLQNAEISNVTYDLRVGDKYRDHRDDHARELGEADTIELHPQSAVVIETEELVHFPRTIFGLVVPRVSLLQRGLSITTTKVDPGYEGHLLVTAFNLGQRKVELKRGERFCALCAFSVQEGARPYDKPGKRLNVGPTKEGWHRIRDFLQANIALLMLGVIVFEFVLAVALFAT